MSQPVRVRFAPSPTGHLHIGGARTAIYNWAFARHTGGVFVLRIDDTDRERSTEENTQAIMRAMRWLGLDWDEGPEAGGDYGPYFQSQRADAYAAALDRLKPTGAVYPCFCTAEQLEAKREEARSRGEFFGYDKACRSLSADEAQSRIDHGQAHVWRIRVPESRGDIVIDDVIRGQVRWSAEDMDDFILVRSDGSPTYMFATVVDDSEMEISHIIRGDDHLSNTPRQVMVYEALEAPVPTYAHMSLIFGADGKRLSKRHGATSVEAYRDDGYLPEALLNYLALLGWSIDDKTTIFDRETLVREFELSRVSKNPAVWDPEKLEWMNGVYIRELSPSRFVDAMTPWLEGEGLLTAAEASERREWLERLVPLISERVKRMSEIAPMVRFFFAETVEVDDAARAKVLDKDGAGRALDAVAEALQRLESFDDAAVEEALRSIPDAIGIKPKLVFQAVRVAVTGSTVSPPLFESLVLLGRDQTLQRIEAARRLAAE